MSFVVKVNGLLVLIAPWIISEKLERYNKEHNLLQLYISNTKNYRKTCLGN